VNWGGSSVFDDWENYDAPGKYVKSIKKTSSHRPHLLFVLRLLSAPRIVSVIACLRVFFVRFRDLLCTLPSPGTRERFPLCLRLPLPALQGKRQTLPAEERGFPRFSFSSCVEVSSLTLRRVFASEEIRIT